MDSTVVWDFSNRPPQVSQQVVGGGSACPPPKKNAQSSRPTMRSMDHDGCNNSNKNHHHQKMQYVRTNAHDDANKTRTIGYNNYDDDKNHSPHSSFFDCGDETIRTILKTLLTTMDTFSHVERIQTSSLQVLRHLTNLERIIIVVKEAATTGSSAVVAMVAIQFPAESHPSKQMSASSSPPFSQETQQPQQPKDHWTNHGDPNDDMEKSCCHSDDNTSSEVCSLQYMVRILLEAMQCHLQSHSVQLHAMTILKNLLLSQPPRRPNNEKKNEQHEQEVQQLVVHTMIQSGGLVRLSELMTQNHQVSSLRRLPYPSSRSMQIFQAASELYQLVLVSSSSRHPSSWIMGGSSSLSSSRSRQRLDEHSSSSTRTMTSTTETTTSSSSFDSWEETTTATLHTTSPHW